MTANADKQRKPPKDASSGPSSESDLCVYDVATQTEECITEIKAELTEVRNSITDPENRLKEQDEKYEQQQFRLSNMKDDV